MSQLAFELPLGTTVAPRPTTLTAMAAELLAAGPMDAVTLMQRVCRVERLREEAAHRMADALLGRHAEFARLPSGHWTVASAASAVRTRRADGRVARDALRDVSFAVVDVETTGARAASSDRITEIAIVEVHRGAIGDVYARLVNPERSIPAHITALTTITDAMVRHQPPFRQIADDVTSRLAGRVFTAHNAAFDWRFVSEALTLGAGTHLVGPRLCTVRLSRALLPNLSRRSLDHVTQYFGITIAARHRASGDALATAQVLLRLLDVAAERGLDSWADLHAFVSAPRRERVLAAARRRRRSFPSPVREDSSA